MGERVTRKHEGLRARLASIRPAGRFAVGLVLAIRQRYFIFIEDGPEGLYQLAVSSWRVIEVLA